MPADEATKAIDTELATPDPHATRIPWLAAIGLGILAVVFFGLWQSARGDADKAQRELDRLEQAEADRQAAEEALPDLASIARRHVLPFTNGSATSISVNLRAGRDMDKLADVLDELGFSSGIMDRIGNTRALDGTLTADAPHVTASWTYHPDDGLSLVLERTD